MLPQILLQKFRAITTLQLHVKNQKKTVKSYLLEKLVTERQIMKMVTTES